MKQRWSTHLAEALRTRWRRGALIVLASLVAVIMVISPVMTRPANAQLTDLLSLGGSFTNGLSSCAIETVGWVICPTMRSIARMADYGFTYINQNFLRMDYALAANDSGTYKAWELMRTIANALFVVAFMALIYSQISGKTSGGYNIKRLLPRLIVAAIAVNISYYICVLVIDITNIIGDGILATLAGKDGIAARVGQRIMPIETAPAAFRDGTLTTITAAVLGKAGTAWVLLAPVAAVTVTIATICAATLVLLIMRKTVVAMLILASPILFVAYLLPNLEKYFFQGVRLFTQLLLLYPIIALLLGAGQIVSATIVSVGSNDSNYRVSGDSYFSRNGGSGSAITDLTAAAAAVLPLLAVWFVFKNMTSIMNTAGARLSATVGSRRNSGEDKARVTGKATVGAANMKNRTGLGATPARRQAFSRNRRHASLTGSALTGEDIPRSGLTNKGSGTSTSAAENALEADLRNQNQQPGNPVNADVNAELNAEQQGMGGKVATAILGAKGREKDGEDKKVTAKDLFNDLNKGRMANRGSKDAQRQFGAGPAPAGSSGGGGGQVASSGAQPMAPAVSYRAPEIAQNSNIISGSSAGQAAPQIIAIPVQVDAATLLGQNQAAPNPSIAGMARPPVTGTEEKAKARAQKYLFDAERDVDEARDKMDILGKKDTPIEPPHVIAGTSVDEKGDKS